MMVSSVKWVQVLHPWRRIFQQMFNHDRMAGPLYCMWDSDLRSNHPIVTQLGARCRAATKDYAAWQQLLINTLDMQVRPAAMNHQSSSCKQCTFNTCVTLDHASVGHSCLRPSPLT